jgi:hypothetical protein
MDQRSPPSARAMISATTAFCRRSCPWSRSGCGPALCPAGAQTAGKLTSELASAFGEQQHVYVGFFATLSLLRNYGGSLVPDIAPAGSVVAGAFVYAAAWTALWWLVAYALHRRRILIKL